MSDKVKIKATFSKRNGTKVPYNSPNTHDGSVDEFDEPTIEGPYAVAAGVQFVIKVPLKAGLDTDDIEESVTLTGAVADFNPIETQGPVMVVQDPPAIPCVWPKGKKPAPRIRKAA